MTALSAARPTASKKTGDTASYKMKASTTCYAGGMVMLNTNGTAEPAAASASNHGVVGVARKTVTSDSNGNAVDALGKTVAPTRVAMVEVQTGTFEFEGTTLGQEDIGALCYAEDDQTVDDSQGANEPVAGVLTGFGSRPAPSALAFTGAGLNDATVTGPYTGVSSRTFRVQVDGTGTPDTFKISYDAGSTWARETVAMTGGWQEIGFGLRIKFAATTGHTLTNRWDLTAPVVTAIVDIKNGAAGWNV